MGFNNSIYDRPVYQVRFNVIWDSSWVDGGKLWWHFVSHAWFFYCRDCCNHLIHFKNTQTFISIHHATVGISSSSNFIFQEIYNAHILTKHNTCNIIRWWLSEKCKAHLPDNQNIHLDSPCSSRDFGLRLPRCKYKWMIVRFTYNIGEYHPSHKNYNYHLIEAAHWKRRGHTPITMHSWHAMTHVRYHDGCRCFGVKYAPGHQQPRWWIRFDYSIILNIARSGEVGRSSTRQCLCCRQVRFLNNILCHHDLRHIMQALGLFCGVASTSGCVERSLSSQSLPLQGCSSALKWLPAKWQSPILWAFVNCASVSISDKTSYREISQSLEGARSDVQTFVSLWNLTGTSATVLPRCLSNFRAIGQFHIQISRLRGFVRSYNKTSYRILKQGRMPATGCELANPPPQRGCFFSFQWHKWASWQINGCLFNNLFG